MANLCFDVIWQFSESVRVAGGNEERVIAESVVSPWTDGEVAFTSRYSDKVYGTFGTPLELSRLLNT